MYLFGSYADGTYTGCSDTDLAGVSDDFQGIRFDDNKRIQEINLHISPYLQTHPFRSDGCAPENPFAEEILRTGKRIVSSRIGCPLCRPLLRMIQFCLCLPNQANSRALCATFAGNLAAYSFTLRRLRILRSRSPSDIKAFPLNIIYSISRNAFSGSAISVPFTST